MFERFFVPYETGSAVQGDRIAILAPHPDDEVFGCGASAVKWQLNGSVVQVFILTAGVVKGEFGEGAEAEQQRIAKAHMRASESKMAAKQLGLPEPIFLNRQDGQLLEDAELDALVYEALSHFQPTTLVIPSIWEMHRDHRATAGLGLRLAKQMSNVLQVAQYEIGVPLCPNVLEDITPLTDLKWQAMQCFPSQLSVQYYAEQIRGLNQYRGYTLGMEVTQAEAFCCLSRAELDAFCDLHRPEQSTHMLQTAEQKVTSLQLRQQFDAEQIQVLNNQVDKLKHENSELKQQITRFALSLSWRVTKPLRWLRSWFSSESA